VGTGVLVGAGVADAGGLVAVAISGVDVAAAAMTVGVLVGSVVPQAAGSSAVAAAVTSTRIQIVRLPLPLSRRARMPAFPHPSPLLPNHHLSRFYRSRTEPRASLRPMPGTPDLTGRQYTRGSAEMQSGPRPLERPH
jgi:hypothetical protein